LTCWRSNCPHSHPFFGVQPSVSAEESFNEAPPLDLGGSCLEIGCYPGRYLTVFGDLGYTLNGIDYAGDVESMKQWLTDCGYKVNQIIKEDLFCYQFEEKYDVVTSYGFIEHFENWEHVLQLHLNAVADDGYLVLDVPNFVGKFQNFIHRNFNKTSYATHVLKAMYVKDWIPVVENSGFEVLYSGYFGGFAFWIDRPHEVNIIPRLMYRVYCKAKPYIRNFFPDCMFYSPMAGIIAKKTA
jgi:SAM-dependent methyltransferase